MNAPRTFLLPLAALLFVLALVPQSAMAGTANCPPEPVSNTPIASGDSFAGSNCVLNTPGDVDSFVFNANSGDSYQLVLGFQGGASNMCVTLYDPNATILFPTKSNPNNCTDNGVVEAVVYQQTLTITGQYKMVIQEPSPGASDYALSLERISPFPPDSQPIVLAKAINGEITPTSQNAFTFGGVTTGTYELSLTFAGGSTNVCVYLYFPGTTSPQATPYQGCTDNGVSETYQFNFTPPKNATYMVLINGVGNDGTVAYNFEVSCLVGKCNPIPPPCTLKDVASYNSTTGILTMNFTVGNTSAATWNAWLTYQNTLVNVVSEARPITNPPAVIPETATLSKKGMVDILSTVTTSAKGIICSSYVQVNTGTP